MRLNFANSIAVVAVLVFRYRVNGIEWTYSDLRPCELTSLELSLLLNTENIDPCIIYELGPNPSVNETTHDAVVLNVQVTPADCRDHRDGAPLAIDKLNGDNNGRGFAIGFNRDFFLGFRLVSIVAGNRNFLGRAAYLEIHTQILESFLKNTTGELRYIIGSCSFTSDHEKKIAGENEAILMAQVGPPDYYQRDNPLYPSNPWVFGIHVSSDDYPLAATRRLSFQAARANELSSRPVRVIYRTSSSFFFSTCSSVLQEIQGAGFEDVGSVLYDPDSDEDGDGVPNQNDEDFLVKVADLVCPPGSAKNPDFRPAIFMCTITEQDVIISRFRQNGCLFSSVWVTSAAWPVWTVPNSDVIEEFQSGGQWHPSLTYSDEYFDSGNDLLESNQIRVDYLGGFDMLVSYTIPIIHALHLEQAYRVFDVPTPKADVLTIEGREVLRRRMLDLRVDTIFGPVQFNENQRNFGRGAAALQWQPDDADEEYSLKSVLVAPSNQAEAEIIFPSATASTCDTGNFQNVTILMERNSLLQSICDYCPVNTFNPSTTRSLECTSCPAGTTTEGLLGSANCTFYEDNLLSVGILSFGYIAMAVSWIMTIFFLLWILKYRDDPVVRLAQIAYLVLICLGGMISTASILGVTFQAGTGENMEAATVGCKSAPFLYSFGWVMQYGSICAKTLRLKKVVENSVGARRKATAAWETAHVIIVPLVVDLAILTAWTIINPLEYQRSDEGRSVENNVVTIDSIGRCTPANDDISVWIFVGPMFANHIFLVLWTHWLLYQVRNVSNRYQENKYLGMAALFALEVAIVGVPILIAAGDSVEASFFVISAIVAFDNIGVLCFIFVPKIFFQMKGLEEGVTIGESVLKDVHKQSVLRESGRRSSKPSQLSLDQWESKRSKSLPSIAEDGEGEDGDGSSSLEEGSPREAAPSRMLPVAPPLYSDLESEVENNNILLTPPDGPDLPVPGPSGIAFSRDEGPDDEPGLTGNAFREDDGPDDEPDNRIYS